MVGKDYNYEDEEMNSNSSNDENQSDQFGLPDMDNQESSDDTYSNEWDDSKSDYSDSNYSSDYSDDYSYDSPEGDDYGQESSDYDQHDEDQESYYDNDDYGSKSSPVGWIILVIVLLIGLGIGGYYLYNNFTSKEKAVTMPPPKPVVTPPVDTTASDVMAADTDNDVVLGSNIGEPIPGSGSIEEINSSTGRYQIIIASAIDDDLVRDYAKKLSKQGYSCKILAPRGKNKFYRLAVADFENLNEATLRSEQLKSTFGEEVWVMRY